MKKIFLITIVLLTVIGCGRSKKFALGENLEALQAQKTRHKAQIDLLQNELKQINNALAKFDKNERFALVDAYSVIPDSFNHTIEIQATIKTRENLVLYPEMGGILRKILVREGQAVKKGDVLAIIDDSGLQNQLEQLKLQLQLSETTFQRVKRLWDKKIGSEIQYLQAKTNYESQKEMVAQMQDQFAKTRIYAPFSGTIDELLADPGTTLGPGNTPVLRIVNLSKMYVEADVPENYLPLIKKGSTATVQIPALGKTLNTTIRQTGNYINPANRTFRIEAPLKNENKDIRPNLSAKLHVVEYSNAEALMIPLRIISENAMGEPFVHKLEGTNQDDVYITKKVFVTLGKSSNTKVEVLEGLEANDLIVNEGAATVEAEQKVRRIQS